MKDKVRKIACAVILFAFANCYLLSCKFDGEKSNPYDYQNVIISPKVAQIV
jgi:hypothetical protein